jgi:hypothetical protein
MRSYPEGTTHATFAELSPGQAARLLAPATP